MFGVFSFAEHLTFALQALPTAIGVVIIGLFAALYLEKSGFRRQVLEGKKFSRLGVSIGVVTVPAVAAALGFVIFRYLGYLPYFALYAACICALMFIGCTLSDFETSRARLFGALALFACLVIIAFCSGAEQVHSREEAGLPTTIETDSGTTRDLIVLRFNSTALVGFDRSSRQHVLIKGDRVKGMSWSSDWLGPFSRALP